MVDDEKDAFEEVEEEAKTTNGIMISIMVTITVTAKVAMAKSNSDL